MCLLELMEFHGSGHDCAGRGRLACGGQACNQQRSGTGCAEELGCASTVCVFPGQGGSVCLC